MQVQSHVRWAFMAVGVMLASAALGVAFAGATPASAVAKRSPAQRDPGAPSPAPLASGATTPNVQNATIEIEQLRGLRHSTIEIEQLRGLRHSTIEIERARGVGHATIEFELCDDGDPCTANVADGFTGICEFPLNYDPGTDCCNPANGALTPLSDGNACTQDVCSPNGSVDHIDVTPPGFCCAPDTGVLTAFDDGIACTDDGCNPDGTPNHVSNCTGGLVCHTIRDECVRCFTESAACPASSAPVPLEVLVGPGPGTPRPMSANRFLTFTVPDAACKAIRVTAASLPPPFDSWNGTSMWVGEPKIVSEAGASVDPGSAPKGIPTFVAASLECTDTPHCRNWTALGSITVFHEMLVPGDLASSTGPMAQPAEYVVEVIDCDAACSVSEPLDYSPPLSLTTAGYGDTNEDCAFLPSFPCSPPDDAINVVDILQILRRFATDPASIRKHRAEMEGLAGNPGCVDLVINVPDALRSIAAFAGLDYFGVPSGDSPCDSVCPNPLAGLPEIP